MGASLVYGPDNRQGSPENISRLTRRSPRLAIFENLAKWTKEKRIQEKWMDHPTYQQYLVTGKARQNNAKETIVLVDPNKPIQNRSTVLLAVEDLLMIGQYRHDNGQHLFRP